MPRILIRNRKLTDTFNAITQMGKVPGIISLKITRIAAALQDPAKEIAREYNDLAAEYSVKDEQGNPESVRHPETREPIDGRFWVDPARKADYRTQEALLLDVDTVFDVATLTKFELDELAKKKDLDPGLTMYLLQFVDGDARLAPTEPAE